MEQSTELLNAAHRLFEAVSERDFAAIEAMISQHEGVLIIGSDPNDWFRGRDAFMNGLKSELNENAGKVTFDITDAKAYAEGSAGWFGGKVSMVFQDGSRIPFRCTLAFHHKDNHWEITQWHFSIAVPNAIIGQVIESY